MYLNKLNNHKRILIVIDRAGTYNYVITKQPYLKGYSSGQSHFSEINAKLAEENEFVTHFVQKCLETHENEQNVVLKRSEIVRILVLAMATADDGVGGSNSV